jgi:hypothetical protein
MKIMICKNNVPDTSTKITFTNNNAQFNTCGMQFILNPYYSRLSCSEHVIQTGVAISPNLYIAIENSGTIHHLAGVNSSKNKNIEALYLKTADYEYIGNNFNMVPKLIATVKEHIAS